MTDMHKLEAIAGRTYEKTACKMRMAARIQDAMEKTGVGKKMLADMMNKRAAELGCHNTHFMNAHGLYHEEHYTTAYDLALIACAFFDNDLLSKIGNTASFAGT